MLSDLIILSLKILRSGNISLKIGKQAAITIRTSEYAHRIEIDILDLSLFESGSSNIAPYKRKPQSHPQQHLHPFQEPDRPGVFDSIKDKLDIVMEFTHHLTDRESDLMDGLNALKEFAQDLTDNNITLSIQIKGKDAVILGSQAKPTLSKILSGSDNLQIINLMEVSKLSSFLKH